MSLTKKTLFDAFGVSAPEKLGEFFGVTIWIKPISELKRSMRASQMFDPKTREIRPNALVDQRVWTVVDMVCDEDGKNIFTDKDFAKVKELDALKFDKLHDAVEAWVEAREGNA